jgi:hypothetical protein
MYSQLKRLFFILLLLAPMVATAEVTVAISANRESIFLGESFNLSVAVNGADENIAPPDFRMSSPAAIRLIDSRSNSRSSIQIINGQMRRERFQGRVLTYTIKPEKVGTYNTGVVTLRINGKVHRHNGISVKVKAIEQQDTVIVSLKPSSTSVLVEEPFDITLEIAIKELPEPYWQQNEPIHPEHLPHIQADFLAIADDEKDTLVSADLNAVLSTLIDQSGRKPAFRINNYASRSMGFSSLFDNDPFRERPLRFRFSQEHTEINGHRYRKYSLKLSYTATAEDEHTFGPVIFKGKVISDVTEDRQARMTEIYAIGAAVTVRVTPPPDVGRPEEFIGSVGHDIKVSAQLDTNVCKIGDPLTLTLDITGDISISNMRTPVLSLQPALTNNFRIYDENVKVATLDNGKRFKYRVRPTTTGTLEFPPIKIAYYDTTERAYKTVLTDPLPLQSEYTAQVSTGGAENGSVVKVKLALPHPCGITLSTAGLNRDNLLPPTGIIALLTFTAPALALLAYLLPLLLKLKRRAHLRRLQAGATPRCIRQLKTSSTAVDMSHAIREWFTRKLGVAGHSLTQYEIMTLLENKSLPPDLCHDTADIIGELDRAMYEPDTDGSGPNAERYIEIIKRVDSAMKRAAPAVEEEL